MRHLRKITDDKVSIDILAYGECEFRLMVGEAVIFEDFTDPHGISFLIRDFDPDESESWDRCLDTDGFCLECQREILFQRLDLRESDSLTRTETILDHGRSDTFLLHLDIDPELEKGLLDEERLLLDLIGGDGILMLDLIQELDTRIVPCSEVKRFCRDF